VVLPAPMTNGTIDRREWIVWIDDDWRQMSRRSEAKTDGRADRQLVK